MDGATDDTSGEESEMIMACKICLETKGKLQRITSGEVRDAYRNLTGVEWDVSGGLPQHMCKECGARLRGTVLLRRKALASHSLLDEIQILEPSVTSNHIHLADRTLRSLTSNLKIMHFTPNEYLAGVSTQFDKQTNTNYDDYLQTCKRHQSHAKTYSNRNLDPVKNIEPDVSKNHSDPTGNSKLEHVSNEKEKLSAGHASNTGGLKIVAVDSAVDQSRNNDYDSDSEEKILVMDLEEPIETVHSSEYVGESRGGMPIDELIDIYNSGGDGDGRLRELNEHFEGEGSIKIDQGWGVQRDAGGRLRLRAVRDAPLPCVVPRSGVETSKTIISTNFSKPKAYERLNPDLFTFTQLSELEQIAEITKRQFTRQFMEAALKCSVCFRNFPSALAYEAHMQRHNPIRGMFECNVCKVRHPSAHALKKHVNNNHTVKIVCNACDFFTMNWNVALTHEKFHGGTTYQCMHCPSRFNQESTYRSHLRRRHLQGSVCALCGSTFLSQKGLTIHRYKIHPNADQAPLRGPRCEPCDLVFASFDAYTRHLSLSARHGPYFSNEAQSAIKPREARN